MTKQHKDLIAALGQMAVDRIGLGHNAHLLTFMFNQLPGSERTMKTLMREEVTATYSKILTRTYRNPNNVPTASLPMWIASPDTPVAKLGRVDPVNATLNNGLHYHAIALTPPSSRLRTSLGSFIEKNQILFSGADRLLHRIHTRAIRDDPAYVTDYVLKAKKRGDTSWDDLLILPFASSERPTRTKHERLEAKRLGAQRRL